jgi:hypothetical protein
VALTLQGLAVVVEAAADRVADEEVAEAGRLGEEEQVLDVFSHWAWLSRG